MKKLMLLMASGLALLTVSCKKDDPSPSGPTKLSVVTEDIVTVPYSGQEDISVEFICDGDWKAAIEADDPDWISFTGETYGNGNGKLILAAAVNEDKTERAATIVIVAGELSASVVIKQDGKKLEIIFKHPSLAFTSEQFAKIKAAYAAEAPSLKAAVDFIFTRAGGSYNPESITAAQKQENTDMGTLYKYMKGPSVLSLHRAVAYYLTDDADKKATYATGSVEILYSWANACKDVDYPINAEESDEPTVGAGMYLARVAWPFFVVYYCLKGSEYISSEQETVIVAWFRNIEKAIKASINSWDNNDYFGKQYWNNQLAAHMWGLLSIGYALEDASLVQYAIDSDDNPRDFYELIQNCIFMEGDTPCSRESSGTAVQTGEIYDRYRHETAPLKGLQYTSLTLQILSSAARTCFNNGIDMYAYTAPTGENLRLAYEFYAPFYTELDSSLKGGYYAGETERLTKAGDMQGLYELGLNAYPDSEAIKGVIAVISNRAQNKVQMHDQLGYTRLYSIDTDAVN